MRAGELTPANFFRTKLGFMDTPATQSSHKTGVLDIESTLSVTLARKSITLADLLSLVPGSMLTFDIHCDHPLTLEAADTPIAIGETVKIGDKFGLRIREINGPKKRAG